MSKQIEYKDFRLRLQEKVPPKPLCAQIALTYRCNLRCLHCYVGSLRNTSEKDEMDFAFICNIIDQLYALGFLWLGFSGGEPLLREDFADIYTYAKKRGFIITVLTNATLMNARLLKLFERDKPFYLDIPVYALEENLAEEITQVQGSFHCLLENIRLLGERKIPFKIKTTMMNINLGEIQKIRKFARELKALFSLSPTLYPCLDGDKTPLRLRIRPEVAARFFAEEDRDEACSSISPGENKKFNKIPLFRCGAARFSVNIDPFGRLLACECLMEPAFNLKQGSVKEGLDFLFKKIVERNLTTDSACANCAMIDICEICPARAYLETCAWEKPVEYYCQVARIRNEQKKKAFIQRS